MFLKLSILTLLVAAPVFLIAAENVITCDGYIQRLTCGSGVISMDQASYGRTSNFCSLTQPLFLNTTTCSSSISLSTRCNGKRTCEFKTNSIGSHDPCPGYYKYYNTSYNCINASTFQVCDNTSSSISCGNDIISILNAEYGRTSSKVCSLGINSNLTLNTSCLVNVRASVAGMCNGKTACNLTASKAFSIDLCPDTYKYLTVFYQCNPAAQQVVACEGSNATMSCASGKLQVIRANFGRTNSSICSVGQQPSKITNTNCYRTDSLVTAVQSCNGKRSCTVPATADYFGDPCSGIYKYLAMSYLCV